MENEGLYLAAKAALEFIQSIDGYENCVCAVNLRRELQAVEHTLADGRACTCDKVKFYPWENVQDEACPLHGTHAAKA